MNLYVAPIKRGPDHPEFGGTAKYVTMKGHDYLVGSAGWVRVKTVSTVRVSGWRNLAKQGPTAIAARRASGWFE